MSMVSMVSLVSMVSNEYKLIEEMIELSVKSKSEWLTEK